MEEISNDFGVTGVDIEQTFLLPFDPFRGLNINTSIFQNTNQGLQDSNKDGRIELGMFSFDDNNIASDNFPSVLSPPFIGISKTNLIKNGDCKSVQKAFVRIDEVPIVIQPDGGWKFLSFYEQTDGRFNNPDSQDFQGYGGKYNYVPLSLELDNGESGFNYWGRIETAIEDGDANESRIAQYFASNLGRYNTGYDFGQYRIIQSIGDLSDIREQTSYYGNPGLEKNSNTGVKPIPHIAMWITTPEAYSNNRCLCFMNYEGWSPAKVCDYVYTDGGKYIFNWLLKQNLHVNGEPDDGLTYNTNNVHQHHQERVLNQVQQIYNKFNDEPINPYSSLKIRFKMKTTSVLPGSANSCANTEERLKFIDNPLDDSLGYAPQVEVGILEAQWNEVPKAGKNSVDKYRLEDEDHTFRSSGGFNSNRYFKVDELSNQASSRFGGMGRFKNSIMNEWETFELNFNLTGKHMNRGLIYGVPYGGTFDDAANNGPVEIQLNTNSDKDDQTGDQPGEIFFHVPGYDRNNPNIDEFFIIHPDGTQRRVKHAKLNYDNEVDILTVLTGLGDTGGDADDQRTGLQDNGRFLEAYLMYVGTISEEAEMYMRAHADYGDNPDEGADKSADENNSGPNGTAPMDLVVAYWNGERWSYDNNDGYSSGRQFSPDETCFILGRLYANPVSQGGDDSTNQGINQFDKYISNEVDYPTGGIGNLHLFLQTGNNFQGRVLIDDIECFESYEFTPDVDVRKKISVGNYGIGDLTKYYDKELQPEEYKDTTAPLEAQFYFYPQYPADEVFVERTPIYQDFKMGRFYIYDVDWGDGSSKEFTSTPEQIGDNIALYHTYKTNGVFEVTGTMIRVKANENDEITGVMYSKKFKLNINVNEGMDEDFKYFGSDGFSFIPYKNTTPIIGGISQQSSYYKTIKRQIGFLDTEKISIEFKNKSDKLKTELALLKIENQNLSDLEVLPSYMIERTGSSGDIIYNGISPIKEELGKGIGDCDITTVKYYNKPKSIWEIIGFNDRNSNVDLVAKEGEFLNRRTGELVPAGTLYHIHPDGGPMEGGVHNPDIEGGTAGHDFFDNTAALPLSTRYWKNIINKNTSVFDREGINLNANIEEGTLVIDTYSEQDWLDNSYYPVLPKLAQDGKFIGEIGSDDLSIYPNNKIPFPMQGGITDEMESNETLLINTSNEKVDVDVLSDNSGNKNYSFFIQDFSSKFDSKTLRVEKIKQRSTFKTSKQNGAF
tara:strand:- start:5360 stop:9040 length:3681 start_codon:yes stop_codon:yes gene_type:complete